MQAARRRQINEAGLAEQDSHKTFDISVTPVKANDDVRIRLTYIQPAHIDTGIGRYNYPLEEGNVDEEKLAFWTANEAVKERFSFDLTLRSGYPVDAVRLPQHPQAVITQEPDGDWNVHIESMGTPQAIASADDEVTEGGFQPVGTANATPLTAGPSFRLDTDIVLYWRMQEGLPGSVDLVTYKPEGKKKGTFMMTITPGDDLKPITEGRDFVFVLDKSGSMRGNKFATLAHGVEQAFQKMRPEDRFRIVLFDQTASELTNGYVSATAQNVATEIGRLQQVTPNNGTNLYDGLTLGMKKLDADRTSAILLVTDGVANVGLTQQKDFLKLVDQKDVRLHTFIMGNSANTPLLEAVAKRSDGTAVTVSNSDDIVGAVMTAASKITHQSLHDVDLKIKGVKTELLAPQTIGSLYRGEQLILFGHYWGDGPADVKLTAKVSGQPVEYKTRFDFPETSVESPEVERLWAFASIEDMMQEIEDFGENADLKQAVTDLATEYSLVTPYTSMVVLREDVFKALNIERRNKQRVEIEQKAQQQRAAQPVVNRRVDTQTPMYTSHRASHSGSGGGGAGNVGLIGLLMAWIAGIRTRFAARRVA